MRILFLTPDWPEPADQGGKLRTHAFIRAAAAHHQVDVLSFASPVAPPAPDATATENDTTQQPEVAYPPRESESLPPSPPREGGSLVPSPPREGGSLVPSPPREGGSLIPSPPRGGGLGRGGTPDAENAISLAPIAGSLLAACRRVITVPAPQRRPMWRRAWDLWFDQVPDLAHRLESSAFHDALWELLEHERYDVVQLEGLEMMPFLGAVRAGAPRAAVIYDAHNAEMTLQRTMWQAELRNPARWHGAAYSFTQWSKLGTYERVMMNSTDMVIAVSPEDAARLKGRHVDPEVVPNGVDTKSVPFRGPPSAERPPSLTLPRAGGRGPLPAALNLPHARGGPLPPALTLPPAGEEPIPAPLASLALNGRDDGNPAGHAPTLFFIGPMDYRPNADAARWLVRSILPAVRAQRPDVRLRLVGKGSERFRGEGVDALGYVPDVAAELARASALVVPMRMGGGVRFKILEAMAAGVPVVSTPLGLAGIAAEDDRDALVATSTATFAAAIVRILDDPALASRLTVAARRLVEARYDWGQVIPGYLRLLSAARHQVRVAR